MKELEDKILQDGKVRPGGILKVDSFLNHQIDPQLLYDMAVELKRLYDGAGVNKILTVESSGIAIAAMAGYVFSCPLVFAKKSKTRNMAALPLRLWQGMFSPARWYLQKRAKPGTWPIPCGVRKWSLSHMAGATRSWCRKNTSALTIVY